MASSVRRRNSCRNAKRLFFSIVRCRLGFYATTATGVVEEKKRIRESSSGESRVYIRFSHFDFPAVQPRRLQTSLNTGTPPTMAAIGKGKINGGHSSRVSRAPPCGAGICRHLAGAPQMSSAAPKPPSTPVADNDHVSWPSCCLVLPSLNLTC